MDRLGQDIAKTLAGELDCEVRSYSRHGRYGGIVIVSGTYDPAFMQSLLLREKRGSLPPLRYVTVEDALAGRPWRRQVCVVTGEVRGYDQVDFLVALRDTLGATTWDRVTDDTTLLIVGDLGDRESSTKLDMARVLKVKIVRAAEVLKLLASPRAVFADVTNGAGRPAKKTRV